jgi:hypothetical protein
MKCFKAREDVTEAFPRARVPKMCKKQAENGDCQVAEVLHCQYKSQAKMKQSLKAKQTECCVLIPYLYRIPELESIHSVLLDRIIHDEEMTLHRVHTLIEITINLAVGKILVPLQSLTRQATSRKSLPEHKPVVNLMRVNPLCAN